MAVLNVRHVTCYRYKRAVAFGEHRMMFRPRDSYDQRLLDTSLVITPRPSRLRWLHDVFGNCVAVAAFDRRADELRFESQIWLDHFPSAALDFQIEDSARTYPFCYDPEEMADLAPVIARRYPDPDGAVERWALGFLAPGASTPIEALMAALTHGVKDRFVYERRAERGTRPPALTLQLRRGSCRDLALLTMEAARALGLAARFVSGYIYVPDRDGDGHRGGGSTHAWVQIYVPGAGWIECDPTNAILGNRDLIRVAVARDPSQALPLSGSFAGAADDLIDMRVEVNVRSEPAGAREAAKPTFA